MLLSQGEKLVNAGDYAGAIEVYSKFLRAHPGHLSHSKVSLRYGQLLMLGSRFEKAASHFKRLSSRRPRDPEVLYAFAQALAFSANLEGATGAIERLLAISPDHAEGVGRRIAFHQYAGELDEALEAVRDADRRGLRHWAIELAFAGLAPRFGLDDESISRMRSVLDEGGLDREEHAALLFNIGYLLDRVERYDEAWEAIARANAVNARNHDPDRFDRDIEMMIASVGAERLRAIPGPMDPGEDVVLVLGSPRSGTTLVEQILAAHADVETAGELDALFAGAGALHTGASAVRRQDVIKASGMYLTELRSRTGKAKRRIDKSPHNWQCLGAASRFIPSARVIYCERDPRDIAISCYFRNFVAAHEYTARLDWIGRYLVSMRRLMRHWERVIGESSDTFAMTSVRYEELVADAPGESARLVEFLGLEWDEACLRFGEKKRIVSTLNTDQVGRGVYTGSTQRWRRYEQYLAPLLEVMGDEAPGD